MDWAFTLQNMKNFAQVTRSVLPPLLPPLLDCRRFHRNSKNSFYLVQATKAG